MVSRRAATFSEALRLCPWLTLGLDSRKALQSNKERVNLQSQIPAWSFAKDSPRIWNSHSTHWMVSSRLTNASVFAIISTSRRLTTKAGGSRLKEQLRKLL